MGLVIFRIDKTVENSQSHRMNGNESVRGQHSLSAPPPTRSATRRMYLAAQSCCDLAGATDQAASGATEEVSVAAFSRGRMDFISQSLVISETPRLAARAIKPGQYSTGIRFPIFHWPTLTAVQEGMSLIASSSSETTLFPPRASMRSR